MLNTTNLGYQYCDTPLLQQLNFELHPGEILHIRGANGRGKTTLLKLLAGLFTPSTGQVQWQTHDIQNIWLQYCQQRFYLGHELALKENLSVSENIQFNFLLQPDSMLAPMHELGLQPYQQHKIYELSPGIKKKISLIRLHLPYFKLWLLDEPFTALDTLGQQWLIQKLLTFIAKQGMVVITSHLNPSIAVHRVINLDSYT